MDNNWNEAKQSEAFNAEISYFEITLTEKKTLLYVHIPPKQLNVTKTLKRTAIDDFIGNSQSTQTTKEAILMNAGRLLYSIKFGQKYFRNLT